MIYKSYIEEDPMKIPIKSNGFTQKKINIEICRFKMIQFKRKSFKIYFKNETKQN